MSGPTPSRNEDAVRLARWLDAGGTCTLVSRTASSVSVALCTCDGGEEMERLDTSDPEVVAQFSGGAGEGRTDPPA